MTPQIYKIYEFACQGVRFIGICFQRHNALSWEFKVKGESLTFIVPEKDIIREMPPVVKPLVPNFQSLIEIKDELAKAKITIAEQEAQLATLRKIIKTLIEKL